MKGQGIRGIMPQHVPVMIDTNDFAMTRFILRNAWNARKYYNNGVKQELAVTPFRAATHSGDLLSRQHYSCGGGSQVSQSRPGLHGLVIAGVNSTCDGTNIPPSTTNVKYVYDSSDYIRYKKQKAVYCNYNDRSFGGDQHNASQMALNAIRRY